MPLSIKPVMCLVLLVSIMMHAACFADDWWEDKVSLLSTVLPRTLLFSDRQYQDISCRYGNMRNYKNVIWCFLVYKYCSNLEFLFLMMGQKFFWPLNLPDAFVCNDWSDWRRTWRHNHMMRSDNRMENHLYEYLHVFLSHKMS